MKKPAEKTPAPLPPEDAALFRAAIGEVRPIPRQNRAVMQRKPRKPPARRTAAPTPVPDTLSDFVTQDTPDEFLGNGLSRMMLRKMQRGLFPVEARLDLHGYNSDEARKLLQEFLHEAAQHQLRCVLVIHGKGLNSQGGEAILRRLARHWLVQHRSVLGYCNAPPRLGGKGAALTLLRVNP